MSARLGDIPAAAEPSLTQNGCQQLGISEPPQASGIDSRDRPLSFRWKADYRTLSGLFDLPACKSKRGEKAMASIIFDAALSAQEDPAKRISYSRRKAFYSAADRYYGTDYGYDTVVPAVDALVAAGLLVEHDKVRGGPSGTGIQSSFLPSPQLAGIALPKAERHPGELIRLKDAEGNLVSYRDTERTMRDRRFLEAVNRHIGEADIQLDAGVADGRVLRFGDHAVYPEMRELYRVYNGGWTLGGRMYGGWWQQVRSDDRQHFVIDGGEACDVDYEMLHPRLLYAAAGRRLDGDAYTLDGWDRQVCKRAFNILLNADGYHRALGAILPYVGDRQAAAELIADMKRHHSAVADRFHSGAGLRLQNIDSEMAKAVLHELTVRQGITVLPVHDSFIVRKDHRADLIDTMDRAFSRAAATVGNRPVVSKGYREIYPHMVGARFRADPAVPLSNPIPEPGSDSIMTKPIEPERKKSSMPPRVIRPTLPETDPTGPALATLEETRTSPAHHERQGPETACGATTEGMAASDTGNPTEVTEWPREAHRWANGTSASLVVKRTPAKVIHPPAFLSPANWKKSESTELHRIADRPLTGRRTLDLLPRGRRGPSTS